MSIARIPLTATYLPTYLPSHITIKADRNNNNNSNSSNNEPLLDSCATVSGHSVKESFERAVTRAPCCHSADRQPVVSSRADPVNYKFALRSLYRRLAHRFLNPPSTSRGISRSSKTRLGLIRALLTNCTPYAPILDSPCPTITPNNCCSGPTRTARIVLTPCSRTRHLLGCRKRIPELLSKTTMAMLASKAAYPQHSASSGASQYLPNAANYRLQPNASRDNHGFFASPTESEFSEHYDTPNSVR